MDRNPTATPARDRFAKLLASHLDNGTRPKGREPWTYAEFAKKMSDFRVSERGVSERSVSNWCNGAVLPNQIEPILRTLFGPDKSDSSDAREELRKAFLDARPRGS